MRFVCLWCNDALRRTFWWIQRLCGFIQKSFLQSWLCHPLQPVDERVQEAKRIYLASVARDADTRERESFHAVWERSVAAAADALSTHTHVSPLPVRASASITALSLGDQPQKALEVAWTKHTKKRRPQVQGNVAERRVFLHGAQEATVHRGVSARRVERAKDANPNSLPSNGRVAFLVRGEAYRLGGRNLDTAQAGGCQEGGVKSQKQATYSLLKLLVQPLEERGNKVDMFVTETSGVQVPCPLVAGLHAMYEGNRSRTAVFRTTVRMASQADSMRFALDFLKQRAHGRVESVYDLVLIVRHDMVWTEAIDKWPSPADFSKFSFFSACEKRSGDPENCVSDTLLLMPGSLFPAFDSVAGSEGSKCFVASFRHGSGHECSGAVTKATGQSPSLVTDYVPRGSVRRPNPLGWLIGTPPDELDRRKMAKPRGQD
jgi:hypothetical protein